MRAVTSLVAVLLPVAVSGLQSQQAMPIQSGQRVRITAPECGIQRWVTAFEEFDSGTLVMPTGSCPLDSVTRFEVSRGQKRRTLSGLRNGFLSGMGIGIVTGSVLCAAEGCGEWAGCVVTMTSAIGAGAGLIIGGVAGSLIKTDRWEAVPLDRFRVSFAPQRDGLALGVRVAF